MLKGDWFQITLGVLKASLILVSLTSAVMGIFSGRLKLYERVLFLAAGTLLWLKVYPLLTNLAGLAIFILVVFISWGRRPAVTAEIVT